MMKSNFLFSVEKMAARYKEIGFAQIAISEIFSRWEKYDRLHVLMDKDNENGRLLLTGVPVVRAWCIYESEVPDHAES